MSRKDSNHRTGRVALVVILAIVVVIGVSYMPLERWTDGRIKNFNLLSDILPDSLLAGPSSPEEAIDPELLKAEHDAAMVASERDSLGRPLFTDTIIGEAMPNRDGATVIIEDYTPGQVGLYHLRRSIQSGGLSRMAVVGDSYIEGDIFTQDLRAYLQTVYGGCGVGYMNMHSDFPGFRRSVRQGGQGWEGFSANKKGGNSNWYGLSEQYFRPRGNALATYKGVSAIDHADKWDMSRLLFIAPVDMTIMLRSGADGEWQERQVKASPEVQCLALPGPTEEFDVKCSNSAMVSLGVWLDGEKGISVDCMSSRGYSGVTLAKIDPELTAQMARFINYDLIVLEFGINAMSAKQTNYSVYENKLVEVINHVRQCYPTADILLMGIGDRGEKHGATVQSMSTAPFMVEAQRNAARRAHCLFWDTREAMGGQNAIVNWSSQGKANKDYIHLTHKGGAELASLFFEALQRQLALPVVEAQTAETVGELIQP